MKPDLECLFTKRSSGCWEAPVPFCSRKGLPLRTRGLLTFWGGLLNLKGPVINMRHAAFLQGVFTDTAIVLCL